MVVKTKRNVIDVRRTMLHNFDNPLVPPENEKSKCIEDINIMRTLGITIGCSDMVFSLWNIIPDKNIAQMSERSGGKW